MMRPVVGNSTSRLRSGGGGNGKKYSITNNHNPVDFLSDEELDMDHTAEDSYSSSQETVAVMGSSKYPQRRRKRNRLIFNDEEEVQPFGNNKKTGGKGINNSGYSPLKCSNNMQIEKGVDKKIAQRLGLSLRTLLKLPKAHKWVCYEWFYANIDQPLFLGENDFELFLKESFPQLKTRQLKKVEWNKIRRLMGKPRRCSPAFFAEERAALYCKRNKIRLLQQQKVVDINQFKDLPANIPMALVIGARVTALLRTPSDGLFTGTIAAVDTVNCGYRITFDRQGIGSHFVPDYEVLSTETPEFMPLVSFQTKVRTRVPLPSNFLDELGSKHATSSSTPRSSKTSKTDPLTTNVSCLSGQQDDGTLGGFPLKFLVSLVRLSKILAVKKKKIYELKSMNGEAEKLRSLHEPIPHEFQKNYANTILDLERLNIDLNSNLKSVQSFAVELAPDANSGNSLSFESVKKHLFEEAKDFTERSLLLCNVRNEKTMDTIAQLLTLLLHLRNFQDSEVGSFELKNLQESMSDTKKLLQPGNRDFFQSQVEIHVNHIQSSLSHLGNLGAFAESVSLENRT